MVESPPKRGQLEGSARTRRRGQPPRIQEPHRIEDRLDVIKHIREFREQATKEWRTRQAQPLFASDRATDLSHLRVDRFGQGFESLPLARLPRVGMRPQVELALPGMPKEHGCRLLLLEHLLKPSQRVGQRWWRHHDVFEERHRPHGRPHAVERGDDVSR